MAEQESATDERQMEQSEMNGTGREALRRFVQRIQDGEKFAELFGVDEESLEVLEIQAYRLYQQRQYEKALIAGRGILALDSERAISQMIVGDVALEQYRFGEAAEHLQKAHALAPEVREIQARLGEALLKKGEKQSALIHLQAVVSGAEDDDSASVQRTRALLEQVQN